MADRPRCSARSKQTGQPCKVAPVPGATVCRYHGGSAPQVQRAARHRAAEMEAHAEAQRMVARAGVDADPIEHLVDSLQLISALVVVYGRMVADLDAAAARDMVSGGRDTRGELGYSEADEDSHDELSVQSRDRMLALNRHGEAQLHPYVAEYHRLIEVRAKLAKLAADAGVDERQRELAQHHGQLVVVVIERAWRALGQEVTPETRKVIAGELQAVAYGADGPSA